MKNVPYRELPNGGVCQRCTNRVFGFFVFVISSEYASSEGIPPFRAIYQARISWYITLKMFFIVTNEVAIKAGTEGSWTLPVVTVNRNSREIRKMVGSLIYLFEARV